MACPYSKNNFYLGLTPEHRKKLCGACTRISYPAGNVLSTYNWSDAFTVLVDGFVISADSKATNDGAFVPLELIGSGHFLTVPEKWTSVRWENISYFVILKSTVAMFDRGCAEELLATISILLRRSARDI